MIEYVREENNRIIAKIRDFNLKDTFECGQCFRWNEEEDGSYIGVAYGKVLHIYEEEGIFTFLNTNMEDFQNIWVDYFDFNRDYGVIKDKLTKDDNIMAQAVEHGHGIRILNQDEWETIVSFIISARNFIPRIKKSVELISEKYGSFIQEYKEKKYYAFPTPEELYNKAEEELKALNVGYRAKYIQSTTYIVKENQVDVYTLKNLDREMAKKNLLKLMGVGPKVADCILLFSMKKYNAFPIDVWVKRVMEYFYFKDGATNNQIQEFAKEKYEDLGGFAQQYMFYYARELNIGK
ncbi:MAG: 8-oxoguanine DNA glycosylase [Anaeromicrobium sp.]|jgi:N-glycosylase/DNA lyase|uniref:DNA-3-methyladenine glycosylase family protein n=1 Tax=Anaeromicrobium sp. TaxID=1929132 RepID=UPI0025E0CF22|nr:DNA glycosylase [Anaeromicrobium sp.]MCT4594997.1 8-oxoguanine DNA glycosylase [Anaeromicrobium sp.]